MKTLQKTPLTYDQLKLLHTKQLLNRRNYLYKLWVNGQFRTERWIYSGGEYVQKLYDGDEATARNEQTMIREILSRRPHIPNRKEAKAIRQAKAKKRGG